MSLLRDVAEGDIPVFFAQQLDAAATRLAAFTARDAADLAAFSARWARILSDGAITKKTIVLDGQVAGYVASFERLGKPEVSYWLGREFWGQGLATRALAELLRALPTRPLYARVVHDNAASLRVLQKCGFVICGHDKSFSTSRGAEVEEIILQLTA
jgi:RimJ/RimL family protein N-acetyltransferase